MGRNKAQQNTLHYSAVEAVLCDVFEIYDEDGLRNFRSRIRHLRNIGVPHNLPRTGPGKKIQFTLDQILELAIALCLELHGVTPRWAADAGPDIAASVRLMRPARPHDDWYVIFERASADESLDPMRTLGMNYLLTPGLEQLQGWIKDRFVDRKEDALLVLNVSNLTRKVEQALRERS